MLLFTITVYIVRQIAAHQLTLWILSTWQFARPFADVDDQPRGGESARQQTAICRLSYRHHKLVLGSPLDSPTSEKGLGCQTFARQFELYLFGNGVVFRLALYC